MTTDTTNDDKIRELRMNGLGMTAIAKELELPPSNVSRRLAALGLAGKDITRKIRDLKRAGAIEEAVKAYVGGKTIREVALIAGISFNRIRGVLTERGAIRKRAVAYGNQTMIDEIVELRNAHLSVREIGERVGVGRQTVSNILAQQGMPGTLKAKVRVEGGVAYIGLTQGQEAIIDSDDVHKVENVKWHASKQCGPGAVEFYACSSVFGQTILMHRVLCDPLPREDQVVDHWDGNGLDNRKANLRPVNMSENALNSHKHRAA